MASTIGAGEFKARCLRLLDLVAEQREELIITKRGRPIAKLVPLSKTTALFGAMKGSVARQDDLLSPVDAVWEVDS